MNFKNEFKKLLLSTIIGTILLIFFLSVQVTTVYSIQTNSSDINESFQIKSDNFITNNFTVKENNQYWLDLESNGSIQLFILNEGNFSLFKEKKTFYSLQIGEVNFCFDKMIPCHPGYSLLGNYQIRVKNSEKVILLLNNPWDDTISGTIKVKEFFLSNSTVTKTIGDSNNKTNGFLFLSAILILVVLKRKNQRN